MKSVFRSKQPEIVGCYQSLLYVVDGEQYSFVLFVGQAVKQCEYFYPAYRVKEGCRFVKKYYRAFLDYSFGNHGLLTFSVREIGCIIFGFVTYSRKVQGIVYDFFVVGRQAAEESGVWLPSKSYKLSHCQCSCKDSFRQYKSDGARQFLFRVSRNWFIHKGKAAVKYALRSGDCTQES